MQSIPILASVCLLLLMVMGVKIAKNLNMITGENVIMMIVSPKQYLRKAFKLDKKESNKEKEEDATGNNSGMSK